MASFAFLQVFEHIKRQAAREGADNPYGLSRDTIERWRGRGVPVKTVRDITEAEAQRILEQIYWNAFQGDELPPAIAVMVMDASVQSDVRSAVKTLQRAYNAAKPDGLLTVDGLVGPQTLKAMRAMDTEKLLNEFIVQRGGSIGVQETLSKRNLSWARRLLDAARLAYGMLPSTRMKSRAAGASEALPEGVEVRRRYFFHSGQGVTCYGSFFRLWGGWATAAHVMEDMLMINPDFASGDPLHRPSGLDVSLIGCALPQTEPPAPHKGQRLVVAGYPWGSRNLETRTCTALYEMDHKDLRFRNAYGTFWTARIVEPDEPVVRGMSGGAVFDEATGALMGILTTANHAADFDQDGGRDQSCDFVSLNRIWSRAIGMVSGS